MSECVEICANLSEFVRISRNRSEFVGIYRNFSEYVGISRNISVYIGIYLPFRTFAFSIGISSLFSKGSADFDITGNSSQFLPLTTANSSSCPALSKILKKLNSSKISRTISIDFSNFFCFLLSRLIFAYLSSFLLPDTSTMLCWILHVTSFVK